MRDQASEVMDRLAPHVESAREKATPAVDTAKARFTTEVLPVLTAAVAAASEATEELREEASKRGAATAAALKGEVEAPSKKSHKLRNLLIILGLGGIAAFVTKRMSDRQASTAWQSSYTPTPAAPMSTTPTYSAPGVAPTDETPMGTAAAAAAARARDEGAAGPDEAAADAAEEPHAATTPDNPAEEIKLDEGKS
jgi:hypothetical protein